MILPELTVPAEANVRAANARKKSRYGELVSEIERTTNQEGAGWKVEVLPVEVTVRGFLPGSVHHLLKVLGLPRKKRLKNNMSTMALRGSYVIWMNRSNVSWQVK